MLTAKLRTNKTAAKFIKQMRKRIGGDTDILVGVPKDTEPYTTDDDGTIPVATVAAAHEFGNSQVPERSFLRSTFDEQQKKYIKMASKLFKKVVDGRMTTERIAGLIGSEAQDDVREKIDAIQTPPNSDATILKKGSSNPLVDTGHLKQSIRHEVRTEKS